MTHIDDLVLNGYKHTRGEFPVYTAEELLTMHPDLLAQGFGFTTTVERDLYEYTPASSSRPMIAHFRTGEGSPRHLRPETIFHRLKSLAVTWKESVEIAGSFRKIEADPNIVDRVIERALKLGRKELDTMMKTIHCIICELDELKPSEPEDLPLDAVWDSMGEYNFQGEYWEANGSYESPELDGSSVPIDFPIRRFDPEYHLEEPEAPIAYGAHDIPSARKFDPENLEDDAQPEWWDEEYMGATPELIGYHLVPTMPERDWLERQPLSYRTLIRVTSRCNNYDELASLCKHVYRATKEGFVRAAMAEGLTEKEAQAALHLATNSWMDSRSVTKGRFHLHESQGAKALRFHMEHVPPLSKAQMTFFLTTYRIRLKALNMEPLKSHELEAQAVNLIGRIDKARTSKDLKLLAKKMHDFMTWKIPGSKIGRREWTAVWKTYKHRLADLEAA